ILVGDLNGDSKPDLVTVTYPYAKQGTFSEDGPITAHVILGNGDGSFSTAPDLDFTIVSTGLYGLYGGNSGPSTVGPVNVVLGDFNGDGNLDLAASFFNPTLGGNKVAIYTGDGTGHFAAPQFVTVGLGPFTLVSIPRAPFQDVGTFAVTDHTPVANDIPTVD